MGFARATPQRTYTNTPEESSSIVGHLRLAMQVASTHRHPPGGLPQCEPRMRQVAIRLDDLGSLGGPNARALRNVRHDRFEILDPIRLSDGPVWPANRSVLVYSDRLPFEKAEISGARQALTDAHADPRTL